MDLATQTAWVQGFISAFNYYGGATAPDIASGTDANGVFAWIDNYCAAHPLDTIATATIALVSELSKSAGCLELWVITRCGDVRFPLNSGDAL